MPFSKTGRTPQFERLPHLFDEGRHRVGMVAGNELVRQVKLGLTSGPKTGRIYNGIPAGAPGQYSQTRTGKLVESASYRVHSPDRFEVGLNTPYAAFQENGTRKMAPRPNLGNANRDAQGRVLDIVGRTVWERVGNP